LVLGNHFGAIAFDPVPGSPLAYALLPLRFGWVGVDLFFVLSGYLIGNQLWRVRHASNVLGVFYARRAARVLPLYIALLVAFCAGIYAQSRGAIDMPALFGSTPALWSYFMFAQNIMLALLPVHTNLLTISWSLAIEEQFYVLAPWLMRGIERAGVLFVLAAMIVAISVFSRAVAVHGFGVERPEFSYFLTVTRLDALGCGLAVAALMNWPRLRQSGFALTRVAAGLLVVGVLAFLLEVAHPGALGVALYSVLAVLFGSALLLSLLGAWPRWISGVLRTAILRWFGRVSYGLYLLHLPVVGLVGWLVLPEHRTLFQHMPWHGALLALGLSMLMAQLSWRYLERPLIERVKRVATYRITA
jgi:peptidoglycan/LPS O-acetylase OafA/YrhL